MIFEPFTVNDFPFLPDYEPPGWGDLVPRFSYALASSFYHPYKLTKEGKMVAIGTIIYHGDSAWLASIIVHPDQRNNGYGKKITQAMVDVIDTNQYSTIYLDATEMGFPVYKALGFIYETSYAHFKCETNINGLQWSTSIIPYRDELLSQVLEMDKNVSCEDRSQSLQEHLPAAKIFFQQGKLSGFYLPSFGNGLIIAQDKEAGIELLKYRLENNYYAILPAENKTGMDFLKQTSLTQFRISRRMYLGKKRDWQAQCIFNRISGQLG